METVAIGDLVTVNGPGAPVDGLVFDTPSRTKIVVAVVDPKHGPVFRSVHPKALTERAQEGEHDQALRLLVRRTPVPVQGPSHAGGGGGRKGAAGFTRAPAHRATGR
jgi:hypothetical protein